LKFSHDPCNQFPPPCEFANDINKMIRYLRCPPDSSECYFQMTARLKLCGNACGLLLRTPSASRAIGTIPTIETLPSQTARLFLCRPGTESRCHHRDGSKFAQKRLDSFRLRALEHLCLNTIVAFSQRSSLTVSIISIMPIITSNYAVTLAVSRYGLRPPRRQSERSRQSRRFPRKLLDSFCAVLAQSLVAIIVMAQSLHKSVSTVSASVRIYSQIQYTIALSPRTSCSLRM